MRGFVACLGVVVAGAAAMAWHLEQRAARLRAELDSAGVVPAPGPIAQHAEQDPAQIIAADGTLETRQEHFERLARALHLTIAVGNYQRSCRRCASSGVTPHLVEWRRMDDKVVAVMDFECHNCGEIARGWTRSTYAACMMAAQAWEGMLTARALFASENGTDSP